MSFSTHNDSNTTVPTLEASAYDGGQHPKLISGFHSRCVWPTRRTKNDKRKTCMRLLDIFKRKPSAEVTSLKNEKEFKAFVLAASQDEQIRDLLVEVAREAGSDAYLEIKLGGNGQPYSLECMGCPDDRRTQSEVQAEYEALKHQIAVAASASDRDSLERKLACMSGGFCTIHINTFSAADFERRRALIVDVWARCKAIWQGPR